MNEDQFDDLKQFIDARISQSETRLRSEMTTGFAAVDDRFQAVDENFKAVTGNFQTIVANFQSIREEMADGFAGVGEAIEDVYQLIDYTVSSFDMRLTKLEQAA